MTITDRPLPEGPLHRHARRAWQFLLLIGVSAVALGAVTLAWPGKTLLVAGLLFGIYLVVSGFGQVFAAFGTHVDAAVRVLGFISGIVSVVLGFFCFRGELESVLLLALWIGIGWVFRGISLLVAAISFEGLPSRGWQAFSGVVIALGGASLVIYPFDSIAVLTLVVGWWLIVIGIVEVVTAFQVRHRLNA